jgi:hypothetical protein
MIRRSAVQLEGAGKEEKLEIDCGSGDAGGGDAV